MSQQVQFYSVSSATETTNANGIYFMDDGHLYKGTSRFGANRIFTISKEADLDVSAAITSGKIEGDIAIGFGSARVWNGSQWLPLENIVQQAALVSAMVSALAAGNSSSYIASISQDANGNVTAHAKAFPTLDIGSVTKSATSNGVTVSVTTQSGAVTSVQVASPSYVAASTTVSGSDCGINVAVTTSKGQVTGVTVSADSISCSDVTAGTGTFTNLYANSAEFSTTSISADSLTVNGSTVEEIVDDRIARISAVTASSVSNGITVGVTTSGGSVQAVTVDASTFGNVMHFKGTASSLPTTGSYSAGDIVIIAGLSVGYAGSLANGQEYICTSASPITWELIGDQNTYATKSYVDSGMSGKASIGSSTATASHGIAGTVTLASNAAPTFTISVNAVTTSAGITSNSGSFATASAIKAYVDGSALFWLGADGNPIS